MALNIQTKSGKAVVKAEPKAQGMDYSQHLSDAPIKAKPVKGKVTTQSMHKGKPIEAEQESEELLHPGPMIPLHRLAHINVQGASTINLGDYNSAKIGVSLTMPTDVDELEQAYQFALDWVSKRIEQAVADTSK